MAGLTASVLLAALALVLRRDDFEDLPPLPRFATDFREPLEEPPPLPLFPPPFPLLEPPLLPPFEPALDPPLLPDLLPREVLLLPDFVRLALRAGRTAVPLPLPLLLASSQTWT